MYRRFRKGSHLYVCRFYSYIHGRNNVNTSLYDWQRAMMKKRIDDDLNFLSRNFDALLALTTSNVYPPISNARPLDNISKCRSFLPPDHPHYRPPLTRPPPAPGGAPDTLPGVRFVYMHACMFACVRVRSSYMCVFSFHHRFHLFCHWQAGLTEKEREKFRTSYVQQKQQRELQKKQKYVIHSFIHSNTHAHAFELTTTTKKTE